MFSIFPVLLLVLKNLLKDEITYWLTLIGCYMNRPYDLDRNPKTKDWLMIFNPGNGDWECCSLTYHFGFRKSGNGAFVHHYDKEWNIKFTERIPFGRWTNVNKARIEDITCIDGLEEYITKQTSKHYGTKRYNDIVSHRYNEHPVVPRNSV